MAPRSSNNDEHDNDTNSAVMRNDIRYMRADIAEIKADLKASNLTFLSKDESSYKFAEVDLRIKALETINENEAKDRKFYKQTAIGAIISNLVTLALGAILAVKLFGGH